jgi:UDP-glucose 4-epimerase
VHLASSTTPGVSAREPELEAPNLALTLQLLQLLQAYPSMHLIFFSSGGAVYGNPAQLPVPEDALLAPLSYHGAAKVAQEMLCQVERAHGRRVSILRPSNAYGPGQGLRAGFGLVRTLLEHARSGSEMEIWGEGTHLRDYIYIDDVVEVTCRLIDDPGRSGTYNLGSGVGHSILEVCSLVETVCGRKIRTVLRPARGADVREVVLDCRRLREAIGRPTVTTDLVTGIRKTWAWLQQQ